MDIDPSRRGLKSEDQDLRTRAQGEINAPLRLDRLGRRHPLLGPGRQTRRSCELLTIFEAHWGYTWGTDSGYCECCQCQFRVRRVCSVHATNGVCIYKPTLAYTHARTITLTHTRKQAQAPASERHAVRGWTDSECHAVRGCTGSIRSRSIDVGERYKPAEYRWVNERRKTKHH